MSLTKLSFIGEMHSADFDWSTNLKALLANNRCESASPRSVEIKPISSQSYAVIEIADNVASSAKPTFLPKCLCAEHRAEELLKFDYFVCFPTVSFGEYQRRLGVP